MSQLYIPGAGHHVTYDHSESHLEHATKSLSHLPPEKMKELFDKASRGEHAEFTYNDRSFKLKHGDGGYFIERHHHSY